MRFPTTPWLASLLLVLALPAHALTIHDESIDGDLSSDPLAPTALVFGTGSNVITGTVQATGGDTRDYITFTLAPGQALVALNQLDYTDVASGGPGDRGFHLLDDGTTSVIPAGGTIGSVLGGNHLDPVGGDLLPALAAAPLGGSGFPIPLGPGDYTYLIQQTGSELTAYSLGFVITPEPELFALLLGAGLMFLALRR